MNINEIFTEASSYDETIQINELLGANESYYCLNDIFHILPDTITYKGKKGYLSVGPLGIDWTSLRSDYKLNLVWASSTVPNKNIFRCFIEALEFLCQNNITILQKNSKY